MTRLNLLVALSVVFLMFLSGAFFVVGETERALVLRLGKVITDDTGKAEIREPGLHFKFPLIEKVLHIDRRLQTLEIQRSRIVTNEKKDVLVDSFVKWRVNDFNLYFVRTGGSKQRAETLLRQKVVEGLRGEFGRRTIKDVVSGERLQIMDEIRDGANKSAAGLGVSVIDARIKAIDLPVEVSEAVYARMRTERERIASEHRAKGKEKAEKLRAEADRRVTVILAEAAAEAQQIRGAGDAEAAKIYSVAFNQDPEFFSFYRSLEAYREAFKGENNVMVLKPDSDFFKYLSNSKGS